jgi:signal recognition particle subunit SRP54
VILDTAGRLHVDGQMMSELKVIKSKLKPTEVLLVADAMTGQDAVRVASEFKEQVGITGLILTKVDGDARGGAAISMREVTGVPIKFLTVGEKMDALEVFHPDRLASRILGMGDMLSLIEKAEASLDKDQAMALGRKLRAATFDLEDFRKQLLEVRKMGPIGQLLDMIPGLAQANRDIPADLTEKQVKQVEAIISSMTPDERRRPDVINGSRKRRIARGSGTSVQDVNQLLSQFRQMQRMMKGLASGKKGGLANLFRQ